MTAADPAVPSPATQITGPPAAERVPASVWLIAAGIFAMVTSEFMAAGLLPTISADIGVTVGVASLLISGFAAGQVLGPWLLGLPLARFGPDRTFVALLLLFALVQTVGVLSPWPVMLAMRFLSGLTMSAYFSVALGTVTRLVPGEGQPRAVATVFAGVTLGTTIGLPLATFAGRALPWQWAFHLDTVAVLVAAAAIALVMPRTAGVEPTPIGSLLRPLADRELWGTFVTAALAIGATLVGFGFFSAVLEGVTGVDPIVTPWLLALYGAASVVGNWFVGRVTHTGPARVVAVGTLLIAGGLTAFALAPTSLPVAILAMVVVGASGVSLNAAHTARSVAVGGATPAVMTMMPTIVTGGILLGTGLGGVVADRFGLLAPLWVGAALALVAAATVLPSLVRARASAPAEVHLACEEQAVCPQA